MQKIILDTNVLISALISSTGIPGKIIDEIIIEGLVIVCISEEVIKEYVDVINRNKFKKYRSFHNKAEIILGYLDEISGKYNPKNRIEKLRDKDDNKFLELAVASQADYLITGNTNDFDIHQIEKTFIVSPSEYWNYYKPK